MNLERLATRITPFLPSYEARFWWILILLFVLIVSFGVILKFKKKPIFLSMWYSFLLTISIFLAFSPQLLGSKTFEYFKVTTTYLLQIPLWAITITGIALALVSIFSTSKKGQEKESVQVNATKDKKSEESTKKRKDTIENKPPVLLSVFKWIHFIILAISLIYILFVLFVSLFAKPYVRLPNGAKEKISSVERIELNITVPVRKEEIEINISPDQESSIEYDNFLFFDNYVTGITIVPSHNYPPDTKIVTYFTGLSNIWPGGRYHEQNLDFFTPPLPGINSTNFPEDGDYVPVNTEIEIQLSSITGEFVYWDIEVKPEAKYELIEESDVLRIKLMDLNQGTKYSVVLSQAERIFEIQSGDDLRIGNLKGLATFNFQTTPPPNIEDYNRKAGMMSTKEPLEITFSDEISDKNIEDYFVIEPEIEGKLELLEDGKVLKFTPTNGFEKNTDYKVTIKAGLKNRLGGHLEEDNVLEFSTPGYVYVTGVYPRNYSSGVSRKLSSVSVTFNQPVNKSTAQERFSITPEVGGSYSWKGNTMYYSFSSTLSYGTRYTIKVSSGVESLYGYNLKSNYSSVFTTEEETFILNVPQYYQTGGSYACNLVATKMVLGYKGLSASVDGIKSSIGVGQDPNSSFVEGYGVHWGPISSYLSSRGLSNSIKRGWNVNSLVEEVKAGHPVILFWYNGYTTPRESFDLEGGYTGYHGMHSEVVVGFVGKVGAPTKIILNDPWRGRRYLSISTFNGLWSYLGYKAIVVY